MNELSSSEMRRSKPGYPESYYALFDNLDRYVVQILSRIRIRPDELTVMAGETGAVIKICAGENALAIKITPYNDTLFAGQRFLALSRNVGIPTPGVIIFDDSRSDLPYDFVVLGWLDGTDASGLPLLASWEAGFLAGEMLRKLHSVPVSGFGMPLRNGQWTASSWLDALRQTYLSWEVEQARDVLFSDWQTCRIEKLTFYNERLDVPTPRLIHSDFGKGILAGTRSGPSLPARKRIGISTCLCFLCTGLHVGCIRQTVSTSQPGMKFSD